MTEPIKHEHRSSRHRKRSKPGFYDTYVKTPLFFAVPFIVWIISKQIGISHYLMGLGMVAVFAITLASLLKSQALFFLSVSGVIATTMMEVWLWTDAYLIPMISTKITSDIPLFRKGIIEIALALLLIIMYKEQLHHLKMKIKFDWYSSSIYRKFIRLLIYFFIFLLIFWIFGFASHAILAGMKYEKTDITLGAAIAAFVVTSIPALLHFLKNTGSVRPRRHHAHRRHHSTREE